MKRRKDYSSTKVKTGNLLINVSYRRFKQSDFNKTSFIVDILSFLAQNYAVISKPNVTYQKANNIVKNYLLEESNRINILKYKVEETFPLIHYIYSLLFRKIYHRTNNFRIQNKNNLHFYFQT